MTDYFYLCITNCGYIFKIHVDICTIVRNHVPPFLIFLLRVDWTPPPGFSFFYVKPYVTA